MEVSSTPTKQGDNYGTRRNTRSSANQDKDKDNADNGKSGCAGNNADKDQDASATNEVTKKKQIKVVRAQNGDVLEYTTEDDITYKPLDSVYLTTERPDNPYFIGTVQDIKVSKRDNAIVSVKWYYRPTEVPELVYQMLVKERYNQVEDPTMKERIMKPDIINRELFVDDRMDAAETYPISSLRGKCEVTNYNGISEVADFEPRADHFFYIFGYNPDTRRLANPKGDTSIGPSHQWNASLRGIFQKAELPDLLSSSDEGHYEKGRVYEEATWQPNVNKCDLIMCLRAARSLAAFAGVCDGVSPEEGCIVASRDDTTINALRVLFENNGDTRKAIDALVKNPVPVTIESKWTDDQVKRFQKGLRLHGKKFFKIRKELLPMKETGELVEFYYLWKKTQDSLMVRSHNRKHRRKVVMKSAGKLKANNGNGNGSGDQTSTEEETEESEESEKEVNYKCKHCDTSTSNKWLPGGKEGAMLCSDCRIFFKKYGENRPVIKVEDLESENETDADTPPVVTKSQHPPFLFKPIKEDKMVVSNLIPRKPAKSLAKVNSTVEVKVRTQKHGKRQWSNSEETKVKREAAMPAKVKRPKTEPSEADNHSQPDQDGRAGISASGEMLNEETKESTPEQKPFLSPAGLSLPPNNVPNDIASQAGSFSPYSPMVPREALTSVSAKPNPVPHHVKDSVGMPPFVSVGQAQLPFTKPSELEAISKLAIELMPRSVYPTVGYVGTGTSTTLSSQTSTSRQSSSTYSLSGSTAVVTTSTVRSSPTVEPSGGQHPRASEVEALGQSHPRERLPPRDVTENRHHNDQSPLRPRAPGDGENLGSLHHGGCNPPPLAITRSSRFPFDPGFTDQIFSKANMSRMPVKEEGHVASPSKYPDGLRPPHPHIGPSRSSPIPRHSVKQESYPNPQTGRLYPHAEPVQRHPQPGHHRPLAPSPSPQGSRHPGSSWPPNPLTQPCRPGSPRQGRSTPVENRSRPPHRDDSNVEVINDDGPDLSPTIPDNKTISTFGKSGRFLRVWNRGSNSCFRTDYVYMPDQASEKKRAHALWEARQKQSPAQDAGNPPPAKRPHTPSGPPSEQGRKRDEKSDAPERSRRDAPPPSSSALPNPAHRSTPGQANAPPTRTPTTSYEQHSRPTPTTFVSPVNDTPALRQLQQYATFDMRRNATTEAAMGPMNPYLFGVVTEAELRERELREREAWERLAKMGADVKPQEMLNPHQMLAHVTGLPVSAVPASMAGPHLASVEQQLQMRHYQAQLLNSLPPGLNSHSDLAMAANLSSGMIPGNPFMSEAYAAAERLSFERLQAERLAAAEQRYQLEWLHHHSHSHVHSHLHLHPLGQHGRPPGPPPSTPHPLGLPPPPPGLAMTDQLIHPYATAMQAMNPLAAAAGNPDILLSPMIRNQQVAAQAALMQQSLAAPHLQAAAAASAREQTSVAQPHPFSQNLQAIHEQHVIEAQHRARALQEQQFLAQAAAARYKS